jgi:hypothetical protein
VSTVTNTANNETIDLEAESIDSEEQEQKQEQDNESYIEESEQKEE